MKRPVECVLFVMKATVQSSKRRTYRALAVIERAMSLEPRVVKEVVFKAQCAANLSADIRRANRRLCRCNADLQHSVGVPT